MSAVAIGTAVVTYGPWVIAAASGAAAALPQGGPAWWSGARQVIDFLAMNFGNAKNAPKA